MAAGTQPKKVDHQLLLFVPFMEKVKVRGIQFLANSTDAKASAPAKVKVFVGGANLDFDGAASTPATQAVCAVSCRLSLTHHSFSFSLLFGCCCLHGAVEPDPGAGGWT
jgi:hypothetical protein